MFIRLFFLTCCPCLKKIKKFFEMAIIRPSGIVEWLHQGRVHRYGKEKMRHLRKSINCDAS